MNPTAAVTAWAEAATLGAILLQPQQVTAVSWLRGGDFADPWHARVHNLLRQHEVAEVTPQRLAGVPGGLAWSPVRGCEAPRTALVRARGLAAGVWYGNSVSDGSFWQGQTETALRCLLHAAALDSRGALDLYRWSLNPVLATDAVTVLTRSPTAADGWADALDAIVHTDPRTRDSIWLGVRQALAALADPDVLASRPGSGPPWIRSEM